MNGGVRLTDSEEGEIMATLVARTKAGQPVGNIVADVLADRQKGEDMTTETETTPETPTLDRMSELRPQLDVIGEFLDWLLSEGYVLGGFQYHPLCVRHEYADPEADCRCGLRDTECWGQNPDCPDAGEHIDPVWYLPLRDRSESHDKLMARFFDIDQDAVEAEKRALLAFVGGVQ